MLRTHRTTIGTAINSVTRQRGKISEQSKPTLPSKIGDMRGINSGYRPDRTIPRRFIVGA